MTELSLPDSICLLIFAISIFAAVEGVAFASRLDRRFSIHLTFDRRK